MELEYSCATNSPTASGSPIKPLLPNKPRGVPRVNDRRVLNGIFWILRLIERFFNKVKQCRRVATRYDKLAANYLAFVQLASIRLWLRVNEYTA
jgi:transposase